MSGLAQLWPLQGARNSRKCPCELACFGAATHHVGARYRPACARRLLARRRAVPLVGAIGLLALAAGWFLGHLAVFRWMLLAVPLIALCWAGLLWKSGLLPFPAAGILCLLQAPTLSAMLGHFQLPYVYGAGAANLLIWAAVPLWLAPKRTPLPVAAGALFFGVAAGWAAANAFPPASAFVVCSLTFGAARKRSSMPFGLFHPGYFTTL
jgi:hypothetical protein